MIPTCNVSRFTKFMVPLGLQPASSGRFVTLFHATVFARTVEFSLIPCRNEDGQFPTRPKPHCHPWCFGKWQPMHRHRQGLIVLESSGSERPPETN